MQTPSNHSDVIGKPLRMPMFQPGRLERMLIAVINRLHRGKLTVNFPSGNSYSLTGRQDKIDGRRFHAILNLKSYRAIRQVTIGSSQAASTVSGSDCRKTPANSRQLFPLHSSHGHRRGTRTGCRCYWMGHLQYSGRDKTHRRCRRASS